MNKTISKIVKLLTLPYKQKEEEWITRGIITSKIEQRIKNSNLVHVTSGITVIENKRTLIFTIKVNEKQALYLLFTSNKNILKERFKFEGFYKLDKYEFFGQPVKEYENNINKDYILLYLEKNLVETTKTDFHNKLNDLLSEYEEKEVELDLIKKIKELL